MKKLTALFGFALVMLGVFMSGAGSASAARATRPAECPTCFAGNFTLTVRSISTDSFPMPLAGAEVEIVNMSTGEDSHGTTDAGGRFVTQLPAGTYTVHISAAEHSSASRNFKIVPSQNTSMSVNLLADTSSTPPCPTCVGSR